jgi:IS30 family transposase
MRDASAEATLDAFTQRFRYVPSCVRKTLTYDQGRDRARHETLAQRLRIEVFFADPHSPRQRPTHENTNGLIREYLPKGIDPAIEQSPTSMPRRRNPARGLLT